MITALNPISTTIICACLGGRSWYAAYYKTHKHTIIALFLIVLDCFIYYIFKHKSVRYFKWMIISKKKGLSFAIILILISCVELYANKSGR